MDALQLAYLAWAATFPGKDYGSSFHVHSGFGDDKRIGDGKFAGKKFDLPRNYDGHCGCKTHYKNETVMVERLSGAIEPVLRFIPLPDMMVCNREVLWRKYLSIRDGKTYNRV